MSIEPLHAKSTLRVTPQQHTIASKVSATGGATRPGVRIQATLKSDTPSVGMIMSSYTCTFGIVYEVDTRRSIGLTRSQSASCNAQSLYPPNA